ncbi:MAG: hypothetical protein PVI66_01400 [Candidatus Aminicenantes bacterium]
MESKPLLPKTVGIWTRPESPKTITPKNIFDYMDGAGELYLSYRFDHLDSYTYQSEIQKEILVELYYMKTSDDAFGLLSIDWGGEAINLNVPIPAPLVADKNPWPRALYGEGLLRIWSDNIYARVMATQETPESKKAVLELGRAIFRGRANPPAPELIKILPSVLLKNWKLRKDRAGYLRSHLVLNSLYYLGHENMLDLNHTTEAVTAPYEMQVPSQIRSRIQFLLVKYTHPDQAQNALAHFRKAYLPDFPFEAPLKNTKSYTNTFPIEDGWLGYRLYGDTLSLIFECPNKETAQAIINKKK